jgi:hypothetical protein
MNEHVQYALFGGAAVVFALIALVFLRYWKVHGDRLFGFFAGAFACFMIGFMIRIGLVDTEHGAWVFIPRLVGFLLIIAAILDKNRRARA